MSSAEATTGGEARGRGLRALLRVLALALVVKGALVLSVSDVFFYGEELEKGTAAKAMLDGLGVPHHELAYHYYEGGGFVVSHLKALAFLLVGESLLANKLVALGWFLAVVAAGFLLARELFGLRAATWFGVLLVLGPVSFQKLSLISLGIHFEACLFLALAMWTTARLAFDGQRPPDRRWFALGLIVGLGLYFSYQTAIVAAWAALALLAARPRAVLGRGGALGTAGFAVGALPLFGMLLLVGSAVFDIHGTALSGAGESVPRGARILAFLRSLYLERGPVEVAGALVFPLAAAGALLVAARAEDKRGRAFRARATFVALYLALFVAAYLSSAFVQGEVYHFFVLLRLAPAWFAGTLLIAGGVGYLFDTGRRRAALALALPTLGVGVAGAVATIAAAGGFGGGRFDLLRHTKGYDYAGYFAKLVPHLSGAPAQQLEVLLRFDEPDRGWLRAEIAAELFGRPLPTLRAAYAAAREAVEEVDPGHFADYELGLGKLFMNASAWDLGAALESVAEAPAASRARLCEALGRFGGGRFPTLEVLRAELALAPRAPDAAAFRRGLGWRVYEGARLDPQAGRRRCDALAAAGGGATLRAGFEAALAAHRLP